MSTDPKRVALMASIGAGVVTGAGQIVKEHGTPHLTVVAGTFGLAVVTTTIAEVAPQLGAAIAMTVLVTSLFALSDLPWQALTNLVTNRPPTK